jgi:hypothetical protein
VSPPSHVLPADPSCGIIGIEIVGASSEEHGSSASFHAPAIRPRVGRKEKWSAAASETRQKPVDRFQAQALRPLPALLPDYRDTVDVLVHKDLRIYFDGNRYCFSKPTPTA